jgi:hypothetical protein
MQDVSTTSEGAVLSTTTLRDDVQVWSCKTKLEKFKIPDSYQGFSRYTKEDLRALTHLQDHMGIFRIENRNIGEIETDLLTAEGIKPEISEITGNLLMYGGASCQWQTLIGNGTATAGQVLTYFSNAQAAIGVGDSATAAVATHTDLQAASNKLRVAMDATFPAHTDATTSGAASAAFKSTFSTAQANWAWQEWGTFNSPTAATGRMLQRKVESLGTKTSASSWALTVTLTLA